MEKVFWKYRDVTLLKITLQCNFIKITLRHGCSPVNLLYIFSAPFSKNTLGGLVMQNQPIWDQCSVSTPPPAPLSPPPLPTISKVFWYFQVGYLTTPLMRKHIFHLFQLISFWYHLLISFHFTTRCSPGDSWKTGLLILDI